jgi:hypothetical protein
MTNAKALKASTFHKIYNVILGAQFGACLLFQPSLQTFTTLARVQFPKWECTWESLGIIGLHPLHSPPFVKVCFAPKHIFASWALAFHTLSRTQC